MQKKILLLSILLSFTIFGCISIKEDNTDALINQVSNQKGKTFSTEDSFPIPSPTLYGDIVETVYIDAERVLFYITLPKENRRVLMSYHLNTNELVEIPTPAYSSVSISPNFNIVLLRSWESDEDTKYFTSNISTLEGEVKFKTSEIDLHEFIMTGRIYWQNNETVVMEFRSRPKDPYVAPSMVYEMLNVQTGEITTESSETVGTTISPSGDKTAYITACEHQGCLLAVKGLNGVLQGGTIAEIDGFHQQLWSPDERYLVYDDGYDGPKETSYIFDFKKDNYTSRSYNFFSGFDTYEIQTNSTSLNNFLGLNISKFITWLDDQTLLLETDKNGPIFWLYDANLKKFSQISAQITVSEEQKIQDAIISIDLKKIAFIKNYSKSSLENSDDDKFPQELWIANADGTDAKMIYKNYP